MRRIRRRLLPLVFTLTAAGSAVLCAGVCVLWGRGHWVGDRWIGPVGAGGWRFGAGSAGGAVAVWAVQIPALDVGPMREIYPDGFARMGPGEGSGPRTPDPGEPGVRPGHFALGRLSWFATDGGPSPTPWMTTGDGYWPARQATAPHWAIAAALAALAALPAARAAAWQRRRRQRRRRRSGCCAACGYDLRATPQPNGALLGRCPECGAVPSSPADGGEVR